MLQWLVRWSDGPCVCHRPAGIGRPVGLSVCRSHRLTEAKRYCFMFFSAPHYETLGRFLLHSSFINSSTTMADAFCPQPITIPAILSYCGSALDVELNYSLLAINVVGFGALHRRLSSEASPSLGIILISFGFGEY